MPVLVCKVLMPAMGAGAARGEKVTHRTELNMTRTPLVIRHPPLFNGTPTLVIPDTRFE